MIYGILPVLSLWRALFATATFESERWNLRQGKYFLSLTFLLKIINATTTSLISAIQSVYSQENLLNTVTCNQNGLRFFFLENRLSSPELTSHQVPTSQYNYITKDSSRWEWMLQSFNDSLLLLYIYVLISLSHRFLECSEDSRTTHKVLNTFGALHVQVYRLRFW